MKGWHLSTRLARIGLPVSPACARRRRALSPLLRDILSGSGEGRPLTATCWLSLVALCALFPQSADLGLLIFPGLCLFAGLCLIALFDARYFVIPDAPLVILGLLGLAVCLAVTPEETAARLAAAASGFAALRFVAHAYEALRGEPGVGEGDARLFALAGLWLGFAGLPSCLIYAVLSALVSAAVALRQGSLESARAPMPFGPHLALGLWLGWVFGPLEFG